MQPVEYSSVPYCIGVCLPYHVLYNTVIHISCTVRPRRVAHPVKVEWPQLQLCRHNAAPFWGYLKDHWWHACAVEPYLRGRSGGSSSRSQISVCCVESFQGAPQLDTVCLLGWMRGRILTCYDKMEQSCKWSLHTTSLLCPLLCCTEHEVRRVRQWPWGCHDHYYSSDHYGPHWRAHAITLEKRAGIGSTHNQTTIAGHLRSASVSCSGLRALQCLKLAGRACSFNEITCFSLSLAIHCDR